LAVAAVTAFASEASAAPLKCYVGGDPIGAAYDPVNRLTYVTQTGNTSVSLLKSRCSVYATISLGTGSVPYAVAYDPVNHWIYITDSNLNVVYYINGLLFGGTISSSNFSLPEGIAYDPVLGSMVVANNGGSSATFINGTTVQGSVRLGSCPYGVAYSPNLNWVVVTSDCSDWVYVLSGANGNWITSFLAGKDPTSAAYDPVNQDIYISNSGSNNVSVVNPSYGSVTSFSVGKKPWAVAWGQAKQEIYVANYDANSISEISGTSVVKTVKVPANTWPIGLSYDTATNKMFVVGWYGYVYVES